jgi:hypothetical protein
MEIAAPGRKSIQVRYVKAGAGITMEEYSSKMDDIPDNYLLGDNWSGYKTGCSASFKIAHSGSQILLKFYIKNDYFRSAKRPVNSDVNKDNCVELFIRFGPDEAYYNIEFNCLEVGKVAYGTSRRNRKLLPEAYIRKIGVWTQFTSLRPIFNWEIMFSIPLDVFCFQQIRSLQGLKCEANFYSCGDELPNPHYLVWSPVASPKPDFHQPEYFGDIVFSEASAS